MIKEIHAVHMHSVHQNHLKLPVANYSSSSSYSHTGMPQNRSHLPILPPLFGSMLHLLFHFDSIICSSLFPPSIYPYNLSIFHSSLSHLTPSATVCFPHVDPAFAPPSLSPLFTGYLPSTLTDQMKGLDLNHQLPISLHG